MPEPKLNEKRWSIDLEKKIQSEHYSDQTSYDQRYSFNPESEKEIFVIDTPPPYPSGTWHIGAVAQYSMIDVIARSQRLTGKEVYFPWGVDRNGINIEFTVEKKTQRKMKTYDRAEFIHLCAETIEEFTAAMRKTAARVGLSCDFSREYLTDAPDYRAVTQSIFVDLFQRGDIVEDLRPNIYDPVEGTTIADAEVERLQRKSKLVDVKWETSDGQELIISTTRPELICACGTIVVHPDDERYSDLIGKSVNLPIETSGRETTVQIRTHPSVKSDFGSGILMVCSFGDQNDVSVFREFGLNPYKAIGLDGCMTEISGPLFGHPAEQARSMAIDILRESGKLSDAKKHMQEVPVSERGGNPVEIILLKEWYVRQTHILNRLAELSSKSIFIPERNRQYLHDWMDGISIDWPISRRRWYHTEVPIWYSADRSMVVVPPKGSYVQPWRESPPPGSVVLERDSKKELGDFESMREQLGNLVGEENKGWYTLAVALDFERSGVGYSATCRKMLEAVIEYSKNNEGRDGSLLWEDAVVRNRLAERWTETEVSRWLSYRVAWMQSQGLVPNYEASMSKMYGTELTQRVANTSMKVIGMKGGAQLHESEPSPVESAVRNMYLNSVSATIAAGTSEIQRNIVAGRGLGLPRG